MIRLVLRGLTVTGLLASCVSPTVQTTGDTTAASSSSTAVPSDDSETTLASTTSAIPTDVPSCDPELPPVQHDFFSPTPLLGMNPYDMDRDGEPDIVTGRVVVDHAGDTIDIASMVLKPEVGVPGSFTQDALGDVLYASDTAGLLLFPDVTNGTADPIATAAPFAEELDVADVDGDGTDDALLVMPRGESVEVWYGQPDGTFVQGPGLDVPFQEVTLLGQRVALSTIYELVVFAADGDALVEIDGQATRWFDRMAEIDAGSVSPRILGSRSKQDEYGYELGAYLPSSPMWDVWEYDLGERWVLDVAELDLDDDGGLDLLLLVGELYEPHRLWMMCRIANGYERCGVLDLDVQVKEMGVLANPSRVLLSTTDDAWLLELPPVPCPP